MVRLNKNRLPPDQQNHLLAQFSTTLSQLPSGKTSILITELLGEEELIMVAKRLAILILLLENKSLYEIGNVLKVSSATASNMKSKLQRGDFTETIHTLGKTKKNYLQLLEALDSILHLGGILPHYNGLDRYKHLH